MVCYYHVRGRGVLPRTFSAIEPQLLYCYTLRQLASSLLDTSEILGAIDGHQSYVRRDIDLDATQ